MLKAARLLKQRDPHLPHAMAPLRQKEPHLHRLATTPLLMFRLLRSAGHDKAPSPHPVAGGGCRWPRKHLSGGGDQRPDSDLRLRPARYGPDTGMDKFSSPVASSLDVLRADLSVLALRA